MSGIIGTSHSKSMVIGRSQDTAKAWCNFNQSSVGDSFNVSSVGDEGTGLYQVNFSVPMSNTNYSVAGLSTGHSADVSLSRDIYLRGYSALATGSVEVEILRDYDANPEDANLATIIVFGD